MGAGCAMKIEGWEKRLDDYLLKSAANDFQYGVCDCVCFASDWVMMATNIDPMLEGRGQYDTLRKGALLIKKYRGSYEGIMDHYFKRMPVKYAQRGDIVLTRSYGVEPAYGIVNNGLGFFKAPNKGLTTVPTSKCMAAWRVE